MSDSVALVSLAMSFSVVAAGAALGFWLYQNRDGNTGSGSWKKATATYYYSYPKCCPDSPVYDPKADKAECSDFSGCKYMGKFAAFGDSAKPLDWVKSNNIAALFEVGQTGSTWSSKWKNKKIQVKNPNTGKVMDVTVVDTCGDGDCGGCCTANARKNGGTLVDLEYHTAARFWGSSTFDGVAPIEWRAA